MSDTHNIMIIGTSDGSGEEVQSIAGLDPADAAETSAEDLEASLAQIGQGRPKMAFFCVQDGDTQMLSLIERAAESFPDMGVIVASAEDSPDLILRLLRAGADEFFTIPCDQEAFKSAVLRVSRKKGIAQPTASQGNGKTIVTFSGKGGCGTSMIAANLTTDLASITQTPVVVVDLDVQFGDMASMMDVQSANSIVEIIGEEGAIDEDLLDQIAEEHPSGARVLPGPSDPAEGESISGEHVTAILDRLRRKYDYVIVDTSCAFNECSLAVLDAADEIVLVTDTLVPSIRACQRSIQVFDQLEYDREKMHLIVNRFDTKGELTEEELAQAFELPVDQIIPNDFKNAMSAVDAGIAVSAVSKRCELARSLRTLAERFVVGAVQEQQPAGVGMFGKLTQMFSK